MYKKNNKNYNNRRFKDSNYLDVESALGKGAPKSEGSIKTLISTIAMKDLPRSSFSIQADPYTDANAVSTAYPLLAPYNRKVGSGYTGDKNIASGNVPQYVSSNRSGFLNAFDIISMRIGLNYRYLPIVTGDTERGTRMIDEFKRSIAEAISLLGATTYTNLDFNNYYVQTDMPMGTDYGVGQMGHSENGYYYHPVDVLYASLINYQIVLQNISNIFNTFNKYRAHQGEMMKMCWQRETPLLNELFSLTNKKSFLGKLDSLALTLEGEYFDTEWAAQSNVTCNLTSRKSESVVDPLKEIIGYHNMPDTFRMYVRTEPASEVPTPGQTGTLVYDANKLFILNEVETSTFKSLVASWQNEISIINILNWARNNSYQTMINSQALSIYNQVFVTILNHMTNFSTYFKTSMNDLRVVLDTLSRTGVITWRKAYRPAVIKETNIQVFDNMIVNDIVASTLGGSDKVMWDDRTKRWSAFSIWNMYNGIPAYDEYVGGSFLTFSSKDPVIDDDNDSTLGYLPVLYTISRPLVNTDGGIALTLNRLGTMVEISYDTMTMSTNDTLSRLVPLPSQAEVVMRVPIVNAIIKEGSTSANLTTSEKSWIIKLLTATIGVFYDKFAASGAVYIDPDLLAIYEFQIEDMTNDVVAYAKAFGPFRGSGDRSKSSLGYHSLKG